MQFWSIPKCGNSFPQKQDVLRCVQLFSSFHLINSPLRRYFLFVIIAKKWQYYIHNIIMQVNFILAFLNANITCKTKNVNSYYKMRPVLTNWARSCHGNKDVTLWTFQKSIQTNEFRGNKWFWTPNKAATLTY